MRRTASMIAIVVGVVMAVAGVVTWVVVSSTLSDQKIVVADDANYLAGDEMNGPFSAYCQADVIDKHTQATFTAPLGTDGAQAATVGCPAAVTGFLA